MQTLNVCSRVSCVETHYVLKSTQTQKFNALLHVHELLLTKS
jgi:hypothetical protein